MKTRLDAMLKYHSFPWAKKGEQKMGKKKYERCGDFCFSLLFLFQRDAFEPTPEDWCL